MIIRPGFKRNSEKLIQKSRIMPKRRSMFRSRRIVSTEDGNHEIISETIGKTPLRHKSKANANLIYILGTTEAVDNVDEFGEEYMTNDELDWDWPSNDVNVKPQAIARRKQQHQRKFIVLEEDLLPVHPSTTDKPITTSLEEVLHDIPSSQSHRFLEDELVILDNQSSETVHTETTTRYSTEDVTPSTQTEFQDTPSTTHQVKVNVETTPSPIVLEETSLPYHQTESSSQKTGASNEWEENDKIKKSAIFRAFQG